MRGAEPYQLPDIVLTASSGVCLATAVLGGCCSCEADVETVLRTFRSAALRKTNPSQLTSTSLLILSRCSSALMLSSHDASKPTASDTVAVHTHNSVSDLSTDAPAKRAPTFKMDKSSTLRFLHTGCQHTRSTTDCKQTEEHSVLPKEVHLIVLYSSISQCFHYPVHTCTFRH
jgi:hypothetical protein